MRSTFPEAHAVPATSDPVAFLALSLIVEAMERADATAGAPDEASPAPPGGGGGGGGVREALVRVAVRAVTAALEVGEDEEAVALAWAEAIHALDTGAAREGAPVAASAAA